MASAKANDIPEDKAIFADIWILYRDFFFTEKTGNYWEELIKRGKELNEKHENKEFCNDLISAVFKELERKHSKLS